MMPPCNQLHLGDYFSDEKKRIAIVVPNIMTGIRVNA
jgi:hypothetical protein